MNTIVIKNAGMEIKIHPKKKISGQLLKAIKSAIIDLLKGIDDWADESEVEKVLKDRIADYGTPGAKLRAYRQRLDWAQEELSKKAQITRSHISEMENGERPIGVNSAKKLALALDIDYRRLL
ncbi:MAG: helix-turn-helix transcriptional regulator [Pseudomonadota bacterium]